MYCFVPVGTLLEDMTTIHEGMESSTTTSGTSLINFGVCQRLAEMILAVSVCCEINYGYRAHSTIRNFLITSLAQEVLDDESMKKLSEQKMRSSQKLLATLGQPTSTAVIDDAIVSVVQVA